MKRIFLLIDVYVYVLAMSNRFIFEIIITTIILEYNIINSIINININVLCLKQMNGVSNKRRY